MSLVLAISILVGFVVGGLVFFGWSLFENLAAVARRRQNAGPPEDQEPGGAEDRK